MSPILAMAMLSLNLDALLTALCVGKEGKMIKAAFLYLEKYPFIYGKRLEFSLLEEWTGKYNGRVSLFRSSHFLLGFGHFQLLTK